MKYQHMNRMAMLALLLFVTTTTQAFTIAPSNSPRKRKAFDKQKPSSPSSNSAHPQAEEHKHKVARFVPNGHSQPSSSQATALAAFAAAMAPLAANAGDVAEVDGKWMLSSYLW